ncbi:hypothetical protein M7I_8081 [Glarea lozoyensis 74030]|uniref:Uncharacterized protein n=1 Tax=Glarea lozoyensis (strain ATCC 74030 / MF5533) TaxID=1104152 RepID=H0EZ19_GLAL7|nr:hypothetical protein M7I_8081 [Glarea lozoyensis 74030]
MSQVKTSNVEPPVTLDHKSEPVVEVKPTTSDDGNTTDGSAPSVKADHPQFARKASISVSTTNISSGSDIKSPHIKPEVTEEEKSKVDAKSTESVDGEKKSDTPTIEEKYARLLKRFEGLEKKLKDSGYITVEESEILPGEGGTEEKVEEEEEVKPEKPFSLDEQIKYVSSEDWWNDKVKALWSSTESPHTLIVSMKPATINPHNLLDAETTDVTKEKPAKDSKEPPDALENLDPDRITIMCPTLLGEISKISGAKFAPNVNILVAPFKPLIPFRDQFEESMAEKQALYEKLVAEKEVVEKKKLQEPAEGVEKKDKDGKTETLESPKEKKKEEKDKKKDKAKDENKSDDSDAKDKSKETEEEWSTEDQTRLKEAQKIANGMKCILYIFDKHLTITTEIRRQIKAGTLKEIAFDYLWHLFKPGDFIVSRKPKEQAYRVLHAGGGRRYRDPGLDYEGKPVIISMPKAASNFFIDCYNIDYDGKNYGAAPKTFYITPYEGLRAITALDYVPLKLLPESDRAALETALATRGKKFVRLVRMTHVRYRGLSVKEGNFRHEELDGDAVIDFALAFKNSKAPNEIEHPLFGGDIIEEPTKPDSREWKEAVQGCASIGHCETLYSYDDSEFDVSQRTAFINLPSTNLDTVSADEGKLGRDRHMLLPYRVYGYLLLSRKWYPLDIDLCQDVKEINKDAPDGFADLVLEEDHKQIVRALVKTHARGPRSAPTKKDDSLASRDIDIVKGKGKGLIILLHGVPGVDQLRPNGRPIIFSRKDIIEFAKGHWADNEPTKTNWNGRQIKNAFQTAIALAEWDYMESKGRLRNDVSGPLLEARHFRQVAVASARFDNYLQSVRDTDSKNALAKLNRKDNHVDKGTPTDTGRKYPSYQDKTRSKKPIATGSTSDGSEDSDSPSEDSDDEFKVKKQEMDSLRMEKEKRAEKKAEAERVAKRVAKEAKRAAVKEREEERRREELLARGGESHDDEDEEDDDDY